MSHTDRIADLIAAAGAIVVFHKLTEQSKQALEEPVDTQTRFMTCFGMPKHLE